MKVRNDSGKDLTLTVMDEFISWKAGSVVELTEKQWSLIMGSTEMERDSARMYWRIQFPDMLPRLVPLRGRGNNSTPDIKEE